jgi:hypothetical protein
MSNRAARDQRLKQRTSRPQIRFAQGIEERSATPSRREKREQKRTIQRVVTEAEIPPGSELSNETLAAIRAGQVVIRRVLPVNFGQRRRLTYAQKCSQRHRAKRQQLAVGD